MKVLIIEDYLFSEIDREASIHIKNYIYTPNTIDIHTIEAQAWINIFAIDIFWRNPTLDSTFEDMMARSTILFKNAEGQDYVDSGREEELKNDLFFKKIERAKMTSEALHEILKIRPKAEKYSKLFDLLYRKYLPFKKEK